MAVFKRKKLLFKISNKEESLFSEVKSLASLLLKTTV